MASLSGNEPISAENLKSAVGSFILGGSVLYDNPAGAKSGKLNDSCNKYRFLLVEIKAPIGGTVVNIDSALLIKPGETVYITNGGSLGEARLTVSGTSFSIDRDYSGVVRFVIGIKV